MNEVFIAKNGRPYVKDENGKVRFISSAEWEQHKTLEESVRYDRRWFIIGVFVVGVVIYAGNYLGVWL